MRIAVVVPEFPVPSQTFVLTNILGMIGHGHDVHVYAAKLSDPLPDADFELVRKQSKIVNFSAVGSGGLLCKLKLFLNTKARKKDRRTACRLLTAIRQHGRYDCIVAHFGPMGVPLAHLKASGMITEPFITFFHGYDYSIPPKRTLSSYPLLFSVGDAFVTNSRFSAEKLTKLGCPASKLSIIPVGFNANKFPLVSSPPPPNGAELLNISRLVEVKGTKFAIEATSILVKKGYKARLHVVGDGPLRDDLAAQARSLLPPECVVFHGYLPHSEILHLAKRCHIYVHPAITTAQGQAEAQGLSIAEAQAMGLPVVASAVGGIPEGVHDGVTGFLVPEKNALAMALAIQRLIDAPESTAAMGKSAREYALAKFDMAVTEGHFDALLMNVCRIQ